MNQREVSRRLEANKNKIIRDYRSRTMTMSQIANRYGSAEPTISNRLKRWGIDALPSMKRAETGKVENNKEEIIRLYKEEKFTAAQIGEKLGLGESTINLRLKEWGVPANTRQKATPEEVYRRYKKGYTPEQIAESLDVDSGTIYKVLRYKLGIKHTKKLVLDNQEKRIIKRLYSQEGISVPIIVSIIRRRRKKDKDKVTNAAIYNRISEMKLQKGEITKEGIETMRDRIVEMFSFGERIKEISKSLLIPKGKVYELLEEYWKPKYNRSKKLTQSQIQQIATLRMKGYPVREISLITRISPVVIDNMAGFIKTKYPNQTIPREQKEALARKISELRKIPGKTVKDIAKELKINNSKVARIISEYKIPSVGRVFTRERKRKALELYKQGMHYVQIGKEIGVSSESVRQELKRLGINLATSKWSKKYSSRAKKLQRELIKKFYQEPYYYSTIDLAKLIGIDKTTIRQRLVDAGIRIRNMQETYALKRNHKRIKARITPEQRAIMREKI